MEVEQPRNQILHFRNFTLLRNGIPLFNPINLDMYPNEQLFIEGKNGIGKSTFLNFILGKEKLETSGEFKINIPPNISILSQKNSKHLT